MKLEAKVGMFVLLGLLGLFFLTTQVGSFSTYGKKGYTLYSHVSSVAGIDKNAKVKIAGVEVGFVKDMVLDGKEPRVEILIYDGVKVTKDAKISMVQASLLGQKYIEIVEGQSVEYLSNGGDILGEVRLAGIDQMANSMNDAALEIKGFIQELRTTFNPETRAQLQESIASFNNMSKQMSNMAKNLGNAGGEFTKTGQTINAKLPGLMDKFSTLESEWTDVAKENKLPLNSAIKSVDGFFAQGSETLKKVDKYVSIGSKSKLEVNMRAETYPSADNSKGYFGIDYSTSPTSSYLVDVVSMSKDYSRIDTNGNVIAPKNNEKGKTFLSAQMGKRFDNIRFRGGLIESTGGLGVDHYALDDNLKTSIDVYDFNAVNDVRGDKPHAKASMRYRMYKKIDIVGGVDNVLNSKARSVFAGIGVSFVDDDLKYLLSPAASFVK
jgi:phospholipid/cholesterol/gamma-HCH transport system substrate-binding protein